MKWIIAAAILLCACTVTSESKEFEYSCPLNSHEMIDPKKLPTIRFDHFSRLKLLVSHRLGHQIVTRIFAMFLKEVLKYSETDILDIESSIYDENNDMVVTQLEMHGTDQPVINLQVWVPPEPHHAVLNEISSSGRVFQGQRLTDDVFRYGLFVKRATKSKIYSYKDFTETSTEADKIINDFAMKNLQLKAYVLKSLQKNRIESVYQSDFCKNNNERCATVLTSHHEDSRFFIAHIERFKLRMTLYFLGDNLQKVINNLEIVNNSSNISMNRAKSAKFFVLHWNNSEIIDNTYDAVTMPPCELYFDFEQETNVCRYEITPVSIFYNHVVLGDPKKPTSLFNTLSKVHIPSLHSIYAIYKQKFSDITNLSLSKSANQASADDAKEDYYNQIACEWLREHREVWSENSTQRWVEETPPEKIRIGILLPKMSDGPEYIGVHIATKLMTEYLDEHKNDFNDYKVIISNKTSTCKPDYVLKNYIKFFENRADLIGVLGPSCTEAIEPLAAISKHFRLNTITYSADGMPFDDRENYPYFYRTIGETKLYQQVYEKLLTKWNWKRIFALTEDGMKYTQYITALESRLKQVDPNFWFLNKKFSRDTADKDFENFRNHLRELKEKNRAKIVIADVHDHNLMMSIMCAAQELKMTAQSGFVWFLPVYVSMKINETLSENATFDSSKCTSENIRDALQGHFAFSYKSYDEDSLMIDEGITISKWHEKYAKLYSKVTNNTYSRFDDYGGFTYDALWVYVKAIKELIKASDSKTSDYQYIKHLDSDQTMEKLKHILNETNFQGVSGRIKFDKGSRRIDVNVLQWQDNTFKLIGTYQPSSVNGSDLGSLKIHDKLIKWHNSRPTDGSEMCFLLPVANAIGLDCYAMNMMLIILSCFAIILVCSLSAFWVWKRKYEKRLDEVACISNSYHKVVNGIELSEREVRRENVVINRRIGEGQFGMVYGGEALIPGKTDGWAAVAIKTLKPGADVSSRVDFLAESETMKKFDHPNIVKLLGVCLQKEPLYAIMEFMLYGDLKSYLLARRHLLNQRITDDSDISAKKLTLMALDVARGLSYLSSLNYVHRDIACRNCMINQDRVVKIGDFGLTRKTYEQDYYKFSRSGMLPVRWMPRESIVRGNFSHASDIWSYGVLLFEITTLGGFPFQGITDYEVIDIVKANGCLKIPNECKSQLKGVMTTCFNVDPQKRPTASTLVEYILHYPRMVSACRGAPQPNLENEEVINANQHHIDLLDWESQNEHDEPTLNPMNDVDVLKTSASLPAVAVQHHTDDELSENNFDYMDMKPSNVNSTKLLSGFNPDLTATLPNNSIYNPIEPLLHRPEISKNINASPSTRIMRYMPMCGKRNNRSSPEDGLS